VTAHPVARYIPLLIEGDEAGLRALFDGAPRVNDPRLGWVEEGRFDQFVQNKSQNGGADGKPVLLHNISNEAQHQHHGHGPHRAAVVAERVLQGRVHVVADAERGALQRVAQGDVAGHHLDDVGLQAVAALPVHEARAGGPRAVVVGRDRGLHQRDLVQVEGLVAASRLQDLQQAPVVGVGLAQHLGVRRRHGVLQGALRVEQRRLGVAAQLHGRRVVVFDRLDEAGVGPAGGLVHQQHAQEEDGGHDRHEEDPVRELHGRISSTFTPSVCAPAAT